MARVPAAERKSLGGRSASFIELAVNFMATVVNSPRYKWYLVGLLFFPVALNYADRTAISAVFPLLKRDLGMSDVALAAVGSLFLWSYGLLSPLAGSVGDRLS